MTTRQKLEERGMNLNTLLIIFSAIGCIFTAVKIGGPLLNVPEKMEQVDHQLSEVSELSAKQLGEVSQQVSSIERTQAVQTEALKTLAEVAKDSRDLRREFDRSAADTTAKQRVTEQQLDNVSRRLDRLESR